MEAMVCPNEHIAKSLLWKRAYKTILSHKWVGLFLWPASIDGNCPEENHKHRVCRQQHHLNAWQLQLFRAEIQRLAIFMDSLW